MSKTPPKNQVDLTLDSGAFSAWRRRLDLPVEGYIKFIQDHHDYVKEYVNLDVMPGTPGCVRTPALAEQSAAAGWKNLEIMQKAGLKPVPVYHMGERRYWLERMLGEGHTHIGVSPNISLPPKMKAAWLDGVFGILCGVKGYPEVKVHGFGVTSVSLMHRYPWYTVDSISWMLYAAYGWVIFPRPKRDGSNTPDYTRGPYQIGFSDGSNNGSRIQPAMGGLNHYRTCSREMRKYLDKCMAKEEITVEQLRESRKVRTIMALRFFKEAVAAQKFKPFYHRREGLFCEGPGANGTTKVPKDFDLLFTINISAELSALLQDELVRSRLLTYWYFSQGNTPFDIKEYVRTGLIERRTRKVQVRGMKRLKLTSV